MYGKMTTSLIGIIGNRLVSDFSFEVSMGVLVQNCEAFRAGWSAGWLARLFK